MSVANIFKHSDMWVHVTARRDHALWAKRLSIFNTLITNWRTLKLAVIVLCYLLYSCAVVIVLLLFVFVLLLFTLFYVLKLCVLQHCHRMLTQLQSSNIYEYTVSQEECARLRESVPYVKLYRYNPKHLYPKLNGYGDNGHRKVWASGVSTYCTPAVTPYSSTSHARQRDVTS